MVENYRFFHDLVFIEFLELDGIIWQSGDDVWNQLTVVLNFLSLFGDFGADKSFPT